MEAKFSQVMVDMSTGSACDGTDAMVSRAAEAASANNFFMIFPLPDAHGRARGQQHPRGADISGVSLGSRERGTLPPGLCTTFSGRISSRGGRAGDRRRWTVLLDIRRSRTGGWYDQELHA